MTGRWAVTSPDGTLVMEVALSDAGSPSYTVARRGEPVILESPLGLVRLDRPFTTGLGFRDASAPAEVEDAYRLPHGKRRASVFRALERTISFTGPEAGALDVVVRAFDEGVAFRYRFPETDPETYTVTGEATAFTLPAPGRAWIQPYDRPGMYAPAYEPYYCDGVPIGSNAPTEGWAMPALFATCGHWVLLAESGVDGTYFGAHLSADRRDGVYAIEMPNPGEGKGIGPVSPASSLPWQTPWRVVVVGDSPGAALETDVVRHLAAPAASGDWGWVRPGRVSWSWWSDHDSPQDVEKLQAFVDLAAVMGWEYSLVDANWTELPQGTIPELAGYAASRGVGLFLWYNSGGPHNDVTEQPRDLMYERSVRRAEMAKLAAWGVKGVKVDFFHSDKPGGLQLYLDILADAADYRLMVNFHGSTVPRGWSRTWPHLMTMEGVRGAEQYSFDPTYTERAPAHNTILPFTRNAVGPMDYTPVTFTDVDHPHTTTNAHELALAVVFESGLQHFADRASAYLGLPEPAARFLREVPVAWDEVRYLEGRPGDYVVLARRHGTDWYVGGINGRDDERTVAVPLDFLGRGEYEAAVVGDGATPRSFSAEVRTLDRYGSLDLMMAPRGGFAARLASTP